MTTPKRTLEEQRLHVRNLNKWMKKFSRLGSEYQSKHALAAKELQRMEEDAELIRRNEALRLRREEARARREQYTTAKPECPYKGENVEYYANILIMPGTTFKMRLSDRSAWKTYMLVQCGPGPNIFQLVNQSNGNRTLDGKFIQATRRGAVLVGTLIEKGMLLRGAQFEEVRLD